MATVATTRPFPYNVDSWILTSTGGYTRHFRRGGQETFDTLGRLETLIDPSGNVTTVTHENGLLASIADSGGRALSLSYDAGATQPSSLSGPAGLIASYTYEGGRLKTVTYADGDGNGQPDGGYTFTYDGSGRLLTIRDLDGKFVESHEYYPDGRAMTSAISGDIEKYTLTYEGRTTTVEDALGNSTEYQSTNIRGQRRIEKVVGPCASCGSGNDTESWTYDDFARTLTHTDGAGHVTSYTYDPVTGDRFHRESYRQSGRTEFRGSHH